MATFFMGKTNDFKNVLTSKIPAIFGRLTKNISNFSLYFFTVFKNFNLFILMKHTNLE